MPGEKRNSSYDIRTVTAVQKVSNHRESPDLSRAEQIQELLKRGKTITEIQETMGLSYSTLHTYLPYTKVAYRMSEISQNAERVKLQAAEVRRGNTYGSANRRASMRLYCCFPAISLPYLYRPFISLHIDD